MPPRSPRTSAPAAFGRRCPGCHRWSLRLPDGLRSVMVYLPFSPGDGRCVCAVQASRRVAPGLWEARASA